MTDDGSRPHDWDFFVSYTRVDREWAEWVAWQLTEAGYRVLIQSDIVAGMHWAERMAAGIARSVRTVSIVSQDYLASETCAEEWQAAWRGDLQGKDRRLLPVRVVEFILPPPFDGIIYTDLFGIGEEEASSRLAAMTKSAASGRNQPDAPPSFPGKVTEGTEKPPFPGALRSRGDSESGSLPAIWRAPPQLATFSGREDLIAEIRGQLAQERTLAVTALHGLGGVGKSQLAVEYIYRHATEYALVWWVDAEQTAVLAEQIAALAPRLNLPVSGVTIDDADAVRDALRRDRSWLLIFDNAEDPMAVRRWLPGGAGHVLITSRTPTWAALATSVYVDVLSPEEAVQFLHSRISELDHRLAYEIATELGRLPLALEQAAAYLEQTRIPPEVYLRRFRARRGQMLTKGVDLAYGGTVDTAWSLALDRLRDVAPAAVFLLELASLCSPAPIPLGLFADHTDQLPSPLGPVLSDSPDPAAELDEIIGALLQYSLVRRTDGSIQVHRLVQAVVRYRHSDGRYQKRADSSSQCIDNDRLGHADSHHLTVLVKLFVNHLPADLQNPNSWPHWRPFLPHILAVLGTADGQAVAPSPSLVWLYDHAALYLQYLGQFRDAWPLFERALAIGEVSYEPDEPDFASLLGHVARALQDLGRPKDARILFERALTITEDIYGPTHIEVASDLSNLGAVLQDLGHLNKAAHVFERALEICQATYGSNHSEVARYMDNLAGVLHDLGRLQDAHSMIQRACCIAESTLDSNHPAVATNLSNLARTLQDLGRPNEARPLFERALAIAEDTYGRKHNVVATRLRNLAGVL
ncbi:FxSxx-COOH system tetratricopeptide repeat protein, partial [Frankia sp. CiP3]|uniref:FxSxx-COOH system tetratricopeptide repeat protein n=1 Tax=Frankia sp. CiP3 TaxID=2880971 RepID=UPI0027E05001